MLRTTRRKWQARQGRRQLLHAHASLPDHLLRDIGLDPRWTAQEVFAAAARRRGRA